MKKNRMMRLASVLMVLVLLTTSVIGGTFAKYTTQDSASDVARVAKWGVELQVVGNLYGDSYKDAIVLQDDTSVTVQSADKNADVVAPGTKNEDGMTFSVNGTPEVDYQATVAITYQNIYLRNGDYGVMVEVPAGVVTEENYDEFENLYIADGADYVLAGDAYVAGPYYTLEDDVKVNVTGGKYYPVIYKLEGEGANTKVEYTDGTYAVNTLEEIAKAVTQQDTWTKVEDASETAQAKNNMTAKVTYQSPVMDSNTSVADMLNLSKETLTWDWAFCREDAECAGGDDACDTCKADTILGNLMSGATNVVVKNGQEYNTLAIGADANDNLVLVGDNTNVIYACLNTQVDIDITVTQVD